VATKAKAKGPNKAPKGFEGWPVYQSRARFHVLHDPDTDEYLVADEDGNLAFLTLSEFHDQFGLVTPARGV